jgi:PmbA protein
VTSDARRILDIVGGHAHVEITRQRRELLRFGASRITYQHSEESTLLSLKLVRDGRAAWGTLGSTDTDRVRALAEQLEAVVEHLPTSDQAYLAEPAATVDTPGTAFASTEAAQPSDRAQLLVTVRRAVPPGAEVGGSIVHHVQDVEVANTDGLSQAERRTRAGLQVVASLGEQSSFLRVVHRDTARLLDDGALERMTRALDDLPMRALEPGRYRAVLSPQAVATLLATFGYIGLGARAAVTQEQVASDHVSVVDDGHDAYGLPTSFDCEGVPKSRVRLVENGRRVGTVHDTLTARQSGLHSTGHAVPPGWRFGMGPSPSHLVMVAGTASDTDLLEACGTGMSIQRVDYTRVLHPRDTLVTGTTRDATMWIDGGRVVARVPQFRFTMRLTDVLRAVETVGARRERSETVFMESVVTPGVVVSDFTVG